MHKKGPRGGDKTLCKRGGWLNHSCPLLFWCGQITLSHGGINFLIFWKLGRLGKKGMRWSKFAFKRGGGCALEACGLAPLAREREPWLSCLKREREREFLHAKKGEREGETRVTPCGGPPSSCLLTLGSKGLSPLSYALRLVVLLA